MDIFFYRYLDVRGGGLEYDRDFERLFFEYEGLERERERDKDDKDTLSNDLRTARLPISRRI